MESGLSHECGSYRKSNQSSLYRITSNMAIIYYRLVQIANLYEGSEVVAYQRSKYNHR